MSDDITDHQPKTLAVPEAGRRYFDLGRNASYAAAKRGDIATIRIGRLLRVPVIALERRLQEAGQASLTPHQGKSALRNSQHERRTTSPVRWETPGARAERLALAAARCMVVGALRSAMATAGVFW